MIVTFANERYDCIKAVREADRATLHLTDGNVVQFVGVAESAWEKFQFDGGIWELLTSPPSESDRLRAVESALTSLMLKGTNDTASIRLQYLLGNLTPEMIQGAVPLRLTEDQANAITGGTET